MVPDQARQLFLDHCKPGGAATLQRYGTQAAVAAITALTAFIESEARRYAGFYPEASDGRNTFVIFADMVAGLTADRLAPKCPNCEGPTEEAGENCHPCANWLAGREP